MQHLVVYTATTLSYYSRDAMPRVVSHESC